MPADREGPLTRSGQALVVERAGGVATVTLNRPGARNALSAALVLGLRDALAELDATSRSPCLARQPRAAIETIDQDAWQPIPYWLSTPEVSGADIAEIPFTVFAGDKRHARQVRRVRPTPGSQLALFTTWDYHAFVTDRTLPLAEVEADHRRARGRRAEHRRAQERRPGPSAVGYLESPSRCP